MSAGKKPSMTSRLRNPAPRLSESSSDRRRLNTNPLGGKTTYSTVLEETSDGVAIVNESTGSVSKPHGTYGQWLAVNPDGKSLYSGLKELYEDGVTIDWNFGDVRPEYGSIVTPSS